MTSTTNESKNAQILLELQRLALVGIDMSLPVVTPKKKKEEPSTFQEASQNQYVYIVFDCPSPFRQNEKFSVICGNIAPIKDHILNLNGWAGYKDLVKYSTSLAIGSGWIVTNENRMSEVETLFKEHGIKYSMITMNEYKSIVGLKITDEIPLQPKGKTKTPSQSVSKVRTYLHPPSNTSSGLDLVELDPLYRVNAVVDAVQNRISLVGESVDMVIRCRLDTDELKALHMAFPQYKDCSQESGDLVMLRR